MIYTIQSSISFDPRNSLSPGFYCVKYGRLIVKQANSMGNLCPPPYFYLRC